MWIWTGGRIAGAVAVVHAAGVHLETFSTLQILAAHGLGTLLELGEQLSDEVILGVVQGGVVLPTLRELLLLLHVRHLAEDELQKKKMQNILNFISFRALKMAK